MLESYYKTINFLKDRYGSYIDFASTFISPLDDEDINELAKQGKRLEDYLPDLMHDSLIKRANLDGKSLTRSLIKELEQRSEDSVIEMRFAHSYRLVIPNHYYESDSKWRFQTLIGEPLMVVRSLTDVIKTGRSDYALNGQEFIFD